MEKRKRKNVTIFKSGLKMMESQKGSEKTPKIGQTVSLHYNIWLSNESFSSNTGIDFFIPCVDIFI